MSIEVCGTGWPYRFKAAILNHIIMQNDPARNTWRPYSLLKTMKQHSYLSTLILKNNSLYIMAHRMDKEEKNGGYIGLY